MPQIQPYEDHITAQGAIGTRASAADFGGQVGGALQGLGGAVENVSEHIARVEDDNARIWAYGAATAEKRRLQMSLDEQVKAINPQAPDYAEKRDNLFSNFTKEVNDSTQKLLESAPSRSARKVLTTHMATAGDALLEKAKHEQSRIVSAQTYSTIQDTAKANQDDIAANPTNENYSSIVKGFKDWVGGLNTIDPVEKIKWADQVEHGLAVTQNQVLAVSRPKEFLAVVHAQGGRTTIHGNVKGAVPGGPADGSTPSTAPTVDAVDPTVDQIWPHLIRQESGSLGQSAVSSKGAVGVAQVMPETGPEAAKLAGLPWDEGRFKTDAKYNEALGKAYFQKQLDSFGGDPIKALAAYNMGPNAKKNGRGLPQLIEKYGDDWLSHAPKETQDYVAAITAGIDNSPSTGKAALPLAEADTTPQVQSLTEEDIANAKPDIAGWGKLTWGEKVGFVRQAEAALGGQLALDRGVMDRDLKDAQASLLAGKQYPGLDGARFTKENITKLYGPVDGPRKFDQLQYDRRIGGFISTMATMPVAQVSNFLKTVAPEGGSEFADKNPVYQQALTAYARVRQLQANDFMQYAQDNGVGNVKPLDFTSPDGFQASLAARIPAANAGRKDFQVDAHLFSKGELAQMGDLVTRLNPQDQMAYIKAIRQATASDESWFQDTISSISPKNTMLAFAANASVRGGAVQTSSGVQDGSTVGKFILEGAHILQGKDIDGSEHTGRAMTLDDKIVRGLFWKAVGQDAFSSPDAARGAQMANDTYQAVKNYLAADIYHRSLDPKNISSDEVANAVRAVTGGTVSAHNGEKLFLPWGMDEKKFKAHFPLAVDQALAAAGLKGTALDAPDGFHYTNVDEGRYLVTNGNRQPIYGKNGRPLIVDMNSANQALSAVDGVVSSMGVKR